YERRVRNVAEYQMPLLREIKICLKKKCDKLGDAFIDDLGLPRGLKFNPFDSEIIWHLLAKSGVSGFQPHAFIDEFIPTVAKEDGISYTHPQKSPTSTVTEHVNISVVDSTGKWGFARIANGFGLNLGQRTLRANDSVGNVASGSTSVGLQSVGRV
ncbi:suppressor of gamma response 1 isoform X2, partial [Tanacetum coccineum]